jgi:4'-phosphopantetheinyl transferase
MSSHLTSSPVASAAREFGDGEVHVWGVALDRLLPRAELVRALSAEERARAARFRFSRDCNRFICRRAVLRDILAGYLDTAPEDIAFCIGPAGKPALATGSGAGALEFNVAHSDGTALIAVTRTGPVGVDIERIRPIDDAAGLVRRFFSARESALFQKLAPGAREEAFFNLWTRKEAWLKATGEGIGHSLHRVEVTFLSGETPRVIDVPDTADRADRWQLQALAPADGFAAALAIRAPRLTVRFRQFTDANVPSEPTCMLK